MSSADRRVAANAVRVEGLAELQRAVRAARGPSGARLLRLANKEVAETVAARARDRAESLGGVAAKVAPSIKAAAEQRYAKLSFGGARWPMAMGANFGAYHNVPRNTRRGVVTGWNQFPEWGGNRFTGGAKDQFIYWTIARMGDDIEAEYEEALDRLLELLAQGA